MILLIFCPLKPTYFLRTHHHRLKPELLPQGASAQMLALHWPYGLTLYVLTHLRFIPVHAPMSCGQNGRPQDVRRRSACSKCLNVWSTGLTHLLFSVNTISHDSDLVLYNRYL